jgi:hypothetical protein
MNAWKTAIEWLRARALWLGALLLGWLAWLYGKRTIAVLTAKVRANDASNRVVTKQLEQAERKLGEARSDDERAAHERRANTLAAERTKLDKERDALIHESGDLPELSDAELAARHNARR